MKEGRLIAIVMLLQARGRVTAAEVASEFEVSLATARRDLEALGAAGVPVYPQPGRGGGWYLVGGARTDLSGLTQDESRALFAVLGPAARESEALAAALRKLGAALPRTFVDAALRTARGRIVEPGRWGEDRQQADLQPGLEAVLAGGRRLALYYGAADLPPRTVDPWALVDKGGIGYLLAGSGGEPTLFRLDRIRGWEALDEPAAEPPEEPEAVWQRMAAEIERRRSGASATVVLPTRLMPVLRDRMGRHVEEVESAGEESRVVVTADTPRSLARHLAGWGNDLTVLEPAEVRAELARIGRELAETYGAQP